MVKESVSAKFEKKSILNLLMRKFFLIEIWFDVSRDPSTSVFYHSPFAFHHRLTFYDNPGKSTIWFSIFEQFQRVLVVFFDLIVRFDVIRMLEVCSCRRE